MREQAFVRPTLFMLGGLLVWALHFTVVYGANAVICTRGFGAARLLGLDLPVFAVALATLVAVLALGAILLAALLGSPRLPEAAETVSGRFVRQVGGAVAAISLLAVIWESLPALMVPACA